MGAIPVSQPVEPIYKRFWKLPKWCFQGDYPLTDWMYWRALQEPECSLRMINLGESFATCLSHNLKLINWMGLAWISNTIS
jgi:hypothetical protein